MKRFTSTYAWNGQSKFSSSTCERDSTEVLCIYLSGFSHSDESEDTIFLYDNEMIYQLLQSCAFVEH
jgi:hypothetical protein